MKYYLLYCLLFTSLLGIAQSSITDLGGELTCGHDNSPGSEGIYNLIDKRTDTKFLTQINSTFILFRQKNESVVTSYKITSGNDAPERDPKDWTLEGSNDGSNWTTIDTRSNENFQNRNMERTFSFSNNSSYSEYRLTMTNNSGNILQMTEFELIGTGGGGGYPDPPATWQEHWFDHRELLRLHDFNDEVAIYYDDDVSSSVNWTLDYFTRAWVYTKQRYGDYGPDKRLYAVFHTGKHGGGHPATYFDAHHDFRNVIDCGPDSWFSDQGNNLDLPTHEIAHIVEGASKGVHRSPAFPVWGDSKWAEIFNFDVYKGLGMYSDTLRWFNMMNRTSDNFPSPNSYWFRDWFYPIYHQYGEGDLLERYFTLMAEHYQKTNNDIQYIGNMNVGELVHFFSGAACTDLKQIATNAFGWNAEFESQYNAAKIKYPFSDCNVLSTNGYNTLGELNISSRNGTLYIHEQDKFDHIYISDLVGKEFEVSSTLYNGSGITEVKTTGLRSGIYIITLISDNRKISQRVLIE